MHLLKNKDVRLRLAPLLRLMKNERKTNDYMILLACYNGKSTELVCHFVSVCNGTSSSVIIFNPFQSKECQLGHNVCTHWLQNSFLQFSKFNIDLCM